jgi:hypothetical protein
VAKANFLHIKPETGNRLNFASNFKLIFSVKTQQYTIKKSRHVILILNQTQKRNMPRKYPRDKLTNSGKVLQADIGNHTGQMIENEERRERLRRILESRKAKSANDQEKVQSAATNDNVSDISNDAKKAK